MQMWSGAHPLHLVSQQLSQSFSLVMLYLIVWHAYRLTVIFPYTTVRKSTFYIVWSSGMCDTLNYHLFNVCCFTLNIRISRGLFFLQYWINQVIDTLTNLFAFHGTLLWVFVIKRKSDCCFFPSKWSTAHIGTLTLYLLSKASCSLFSLPMTAQGKPQSLGHLEVVVCESLPAMNKSNHLCWINKYLRLVSISELQNSVLARAIQKTAVLQKVIKKESKSSMLS